MKPTDEQVKKFWEWCGFKYKPLSDWWTKSWNREQLAWHRPDGWPAFDACPNTDVFQLPLVDLNNLFKYAVPKLQEMDLWVGLGAEKQGWESWIFKGEPIEGNPLQKYEVKVTYKDPALALFWAIYKVAFPEEVINENL